MEAIFAPRQTGTMMGIAADSETKGQSCRSKARHPLGVSPPARLADGGGGSRQRSARRSASLPALVSCATRPQNPGWVSGDRDRAAGRRAARAAGLEVQTGVAHTGVVAVLRGARPGPTVAVRGDMDALPVEEKTDLPFRSTKRATWVGEEVPVAHACGHDVHTTVVLGVAEALAALRAELPGTWSFSSSLPKRAAAGRRPGALAMVKAGVLDDPKRAIFGVHSFTGLHDGVPERRSSAGAPARPTPRSIISSPGCAASSRTVPTPTSTDHRDGLPGGAGAPDHPLAHPPPLGRAS
jgi:hypothetical protein